MTQLEKPGRLYTVIYYCWMHRMQWVTLSFA